MSIGRFRQTTLVVAPDQNDPQLVRPYQDAFEYSQTFLRIPGDADQRSELMSITVPK